jgi:hypothetical protein
VGDAVMVNRRGLIIFNGLERVPVNEKIPAIKFYLMGVPLSIKD